MKLLVARTLYHATQARHVLGLDKKEWDVAGIGQGLGGPRYERVVVMCPWAPASDAEVEQVNMYVDRLRLTLPQAVAPDLI